MPPAGHYGDVELEIGRVCVQLASPDYIYIDAVLAPLCRGYPGEITGRNAGKLEDAKKELEELYKIQVLAFWQIPPGSAALLQGCFAVCSGVAG